MSCLFVHHYLKVSQFCINLGQNIVSDGAQDYCQFFYCSQMENYGLIGI